MSAELNQASVKAVLSVGGLVLNDYSLKIDPIERGYRLTITRGSEEQTMDVKDGVNIENVEMVGRTGDVDTYRITFTDGSTFDYTVVTNAETYAAAEAERVDAESGRVSAEASRVSAENTRGLNENVRAQNEKVRLDAEAARAEAEKARESAENKRATAENARASAETARVNAEKSRVTAESSRASAETKRVNAETARVNAETARANAETSRATAETNRVSAEKARTQAETERVSAESARVVAEEGRVAAEKARVQSFTAYDGRVAKNERSLDALWKLNQGISYQFETDDAEAYQKIVPSGAKCANVDSIGGKTIVWNQFVNTDAISGNNGSTVDGRSCLYYNVQFTPGAMVAVYRSVSNPDTLRDIITPNASYTACTIKHSGSAADIRIARIERDFAAGHKYFCKLDLKKCTPNIENGLEWDKLLFVDLTILFGTDNEPTSTTDPRIAWIEQYAGAHPEYNPGELLSAGVESVSCNGAAAALVPTAIRELPGYGWSAGAVHNGIERTETGWQYVQRVGSRAYQDGDVVTDGTTTYYALDTPIITDITDMMGVALDAITVEAGGTLALENAAMLPVPNTIEYAVSLAEVNA